MTDRNDAPTEKKRSAWPLFIGLPLIAVLAAAAIFFTSTGQNTGTGDESGAEQAANDSSESAESPTPSEGASGDSSGGEQPSLGDGDAPVVMQEFSDYQ